jgi:succinoglycan biosynthesis transport protein ExoP
MLETAKSGAMVSREAESHTKSQGLSLHAAAGFARRQLWLILCSVVLACSVGGLYLLMTRPTYTALATMVIDSRRGGVKEPSILGDTPVSDPAVIDTQIGILWLERDKIGRSVAEKLQLAKVSEAFEPAPGIMELLWAPFTKFWGNATAAEITKSEKELTDRAAGEVAGGLDAKRVGLSYLVSISYSSHNQELTAKIANAAADEFVRAELEAKYNSLREASEWLQERYEALRGQASAADRAVVQFKNEHNIITAGGKLASDQQLTEINDRLGAARAVTADKQAQLEQIEAVLKQQDASGTVDATVPEALLNPIITKLRGQYLDAINRESDWSKRFGANHQAVIGLRNQARDIRKSTHAELERMAEAYKSELEISKKNERELEKQLNIVVAQTPSDAQITLRGLESSAQSYRTYYDHFLQNYTESVQQQSSPIPETRVVAYAPGAWQSAPSTSRVALLSALGGIALGLGLGFLRETIDRSFRTVGQVEGALQTECIALVPRLKRAPEWFSSGARDIGGTPEAKNFQPSAGALRLVTDVRFSRFTEAIRAVKLAADLHSASSLARVIAVTSAVPREGKSTISATLAGLTAQVGARVILVDCDLRNPALSRSFAPNAKHGIIDVLCGYCSLGETVGTVSSTGMDFLSAGNVSSLANTADILRSDAMKRLFDLLRTRYDYVIVDLSPLAPVVDVRATAGLFDYYVLLIEWGQTQVDVVQQALKDARQVHGKMLGVVLNKVDMGMICRYEGYHSQYYRDGHYAQIS